EEKYRLISENANDLITILNQKFEHEYINEETYLKILGYSNDDMLGKTRLDLIHPDDIKQGMKALRNGFKYGEGIAELRLKHKDGHYVWIETKGKTYIDSNGETKALTISRDITERKKVEQKLKESEKKYRSILENIEEGYFELDLKGNYTFVNEYHSNFYGVPKDEMIGKNYADFVDKKYIKMLFEIFNQVYREEVPSARFEIEDIRYDGEKLIYEGTCNIKLDSNGKKIGFYSLTRDITERKRTEVLREKFTEQLKNEVKIKTKELQETVDQQKLYLDQILKASQFKTEFMGSMSHELRTPLNAIIGFTDLLLESSYGPVNEDQFDFLKDIKSSGEHLLHMIDQILDISRIEAGELILRFQEIHLKSHIAQIKSSIQPMYEKKKLKFEIIGLDTDKYIYADPIRLKEIFYNLLTNAIKFTKKGKITLKILEKEDQWEFQVIDTGIGITKEDFNIIFKEFKRVESPEVISILGSGLGLPITRKLVYMHGGTIDFTSEVGKGSTFVFTIPKNLDQKNQE
ncbi:MAG: PAS domain-containing sensor histidine kinase, partial [Candidatus Lokiarchaeota archaeon]|nr:PAS domain-containing sensor histidine kinase [Candidatus Lokiarchaeota archaeon]